MVFTGRNQVGLEEAVQEAIKNGASAEQVLKSRLCFHIPLPPKVKVLTAFFSYIIKIKSDILIK